MRVSYTLPIISKLLDYYGRPIADEELRSRIQCEFTCRIKTVCNIRMVGSMEVLEFDTILDYNRFLLVFT